ncbi:FAD binding domain of DNA photolyase-domain-containing protein [Desarmillaria ectypa]|nr:FAD binding domain of DNA photolyase-domain-containing protein [Desarmillaria ectypa]
MHDTRPMEVDLNKEIRVSNVTCQGYGKKLKRRVDLKRSRTLTLQNQLQDPGDSLRFRHSMNLVSLKRQPLFTAEKNRSCADRMHIVKIQRVSKQKTSLAEFNLPETTALSPYLKFGCLGVNEFLWHIRDTITKCRDKNIKARNEGTGKSGRSAGIQKDVLRSRVCTGIDVLPSSTVCRFIDCSLQNEYDVGGEKIEQRPRGDEESEDRLAWKEGCTRFPWIDAIMRQLRQEGWIHHLARHPWQ